jgi:hypothetical protein
MCWWKDFKTKEAFEKFYENIKRLGVKKYDTKGRFVYFKNGIGAIYQKTSQEWIEAFAKKAKASKPYENAIRRGRGAFPQ